MVSIGKNARLTVELGEKYLVVNGKRAKIFKCPNRGIRTVYTSSSFIIKIDTDKNYRNEDSQGYREIKRFEKIEDDDKAYFAEPIDWGVLEDGMYWVAQKFENLEEPEGESAKVEELMEKYDIDDLDNFYYEEEPARNWALLNGKPFIYDYAI